jgi:hypothetical protein
LYDGWSEPIHLLEVDLHVRFLFWTGLTGASTRSGKKKNPLELIAPAGQCLDDYLL